MILIINMFVCVKLKRERYKIDVLEIEEKYSSVFFYCVSVFGVFQFI